MEKTKGTPAPGPWHYDAVEERIYDSEGNWIGRMEPGSGQLAAAAPELLLIAKEIRAPFMTHGELLAAVNRALKKAGLG